MSRLLPLSTMSSFTEIAKEILANASSLDDYIAKSAHNGVNGSNRPPVSVETDVFADLPKEYEMKRKSLIDSAQLIKRLALGSTGQLLESLFTVSSDRGSL